MTSLSLRTARRLGLGRRRHLDESSDPLPPEGEAWSDSTFWTDATGWVDA